MCAVRVLLVWADARLGQAAASSLSAAGFSVRVESDGLSGLIAVEEWRPAVVVVEWTLPFITGSIFVSIVQTRLLQPPPVIVLAAASEAAAAAGSGAAAVISPRDVEGATLRDVVRQVLGYDTRVDA